MMKKKILVIAKSLGGGGSEVALIEFLNHLDLKKYNVTLLLLDHDTEYKYRLKQNINIKYISFPNSLVHSFASMYSFVGKIVKKEKVNKYIAIYDWLASHSQKMDQRYDLAIDFYGYGAFTTAFLALNVNADKKAMWLHDEKMSWIVNIEKYLPKIDVVYGVSKAIKKEFCRRYPNYQKKADVFYNVIDANSIKNKALDFFPAEYKPNIYNILTVGRLTEQKGYDISIKAAKLLEKQKLNFRWYAIGDGRDKSKLIKMVKKLGLEDRFIFLGRKNNPYPYIKNCDLFVLPSRHEGYSVAVLEAKILKKLIVTSNIPANKEQIIDRRNGLISALVPTDLAKKILYAKDNEEIKRKILHNLSSEDLNFDKQMQKLNNL